jgi:hypothetical protein
MDWFREKGGILTTGGLCFRISWKWAACKAANAPFAFMGMNAEKTAKKHMAYREPTLALAPKTDFDDPLQTAEYIAIDRDAHKHYMTFWGTVFSDADKGKHLIASPSGLIEKPLVDAMKEVGVANMGAYLYVLYWGGQKDGKSSVFGHAVAFSGGAAPCFFDSNVAEYTFEGGDDPLAFVAKHLAKYSTNVTYPSLYAIGSPILSVARSI